MQGFFIKIKFVKVAGKGEIMHLRHLIGLFILVFFCFKLVAVYASNTVDAPQYLQAFPLEVVTQSGRYLFTIEVAKTPAEIKKGLMFRKDVSSSSGMLFIFPVSQEGRFWMKNTPLSLDVIFIDSAGKVVEICENTVPYSLQSVTSKGQKIKAVLEVLAGTSKDILLRKGDQIICPAFGSVY
jgi:hypothetical protein